jgi:hypothetical protein
MGEWRHSCTILDFGTRWRWVVSFVLRQFYPRVNRPQYPLDRRWCPKRCKNQIIFWRNNQLLDNRLLKRISRQRTRLEESKRCPEIDMFRGNGWNRETKRDGWGPFGSYKKDVYWWTQVYAAASSQRSLSRVRVPWDSRPYFTVSDLRLPISSPLTTRRVTVEVFDPPLHGSSTRPLVREGAQLSNSNR